MRLMGNPYMGEWIVLPDGATVSDHELRRNAAQRIANSAKIITTQTTDGTYTHTYSFAELDADDCVRKAEKPIVSPDATIVVGPPYISG